MDRKKEVTALVCSAKSQYYKNIIAENRNNPKRMFSVIDTLLGKSKSRIVPPGRDELELVTAFSNFFRDKVDNIRSSIGPTDDVDVAQRVDCVLDSWRPVTIDEVKRIIMASPTKDCSLDPLPTKLLKECADPLLPYITHIINASLRSGSVPASFKEAKVTPLLKKPSLDPSEYNNYRPVSNLPFISKTLEKAVLCQFTTYLNENGLQGKMQSAYRPHHSTETALVRMQNDLIEALDDKKACILVLLDLSAAFDLVDQAGLLKSLRGEFGVRGTALQWFASYLDGRKQRVSIGQQNSESVELNSGVPQGSVLGPVLFTVYTSSLALILDNHSVQYHFYADDTSLYLTFNLNEIDSAITRMEKCIGDVKKWMAAKHLKMNDSKSNFIIIASKRMLKTLPSKPDLKIGSVILKSEDAVKSLGVFIDQYISMETHISNTCRIAFYHLCNIGRIRKFLTNESCEQLIHCFITSRIDYCNALFYDLPKRLLKKLQGIQNCAARILTFTKRYEHITPVLIQLHWLPVVFRIRFKILLLVYKCLNGLAPEYLTELLTAYVPQRSLRSVDHALLNPPVAQLSYLHRSFKSCGPALWNSLPHDIKTCNSLSIFKRKLKTHLFIQSFEIV